MKRREFITLLGGAAATWPLVAHPQQPERMRRIGVLYPGIASALPARLAGLRAGLQASDYRDEIELIPRSADGDPTRLGSLAAELVERKAEIIVAISPAAVRAAQSATPSIPIIALDVEF